MGIASAFALRATADKSLYPSYELRLRATCQLSNADSDGVEPACRADEQLGALDDPHFLGPAAGSALQHGEDGGYGMPQRIRRVRPPNARGHQERGKQIAVAGRADRQFQRAPAPGLDSFPGLLDGNELYFPVRGVLELGAGDDDGRLTARHHRLRPSDHL